MTKVTARRTQVYLREQEYQYLKQRAAKEGSIAGVIRSLIDEKLKAPADYKNDPFYKWLTSPIETGISDAAVNHDKYIYGENYKEEIL
jgi:hypothetical protein